MPFFDDKQDVDARHKAGHDADRRATLPRQHLPQLLQERPLIGDDLHHRLIHEKPADPVDLGKYFLLARTWRPFHLERVADEAVEREIRLEGKAVHGLAALLTHRRKWRDRPL